MLILLRIVMFHVRQYSSFILGPISAPSVTPSVSDLIIRHYEEITDLLDLSKQRNTRYETGFKNFPGGTRGRFSLAHSKEL